MALKITVAKPNSFFLLNGDEAVARGALEAGVKVAASYPGTPATEILETLAEASKDFGVYVEWSINEIVAMEVASGASMSGVRSIVSMKHVGLNVAADAAMTLAYTGVEGGMVIAVCDDPGMHSSQNEQDTRYFAVHSDIPLFDAGSPQEALDMTKEAFELSEKLKLPVIVRLTTRVAHSKARVKIAEILKPVKRRPDFDKKSAKWVMVPQNAIRQHQNLTDKLVQAKKQSENSRFNVVEDNERKIGVVGSGIGYYYARSILDTNKFSWLKIGLAHPFPNNLVKTFSSKVDEIVIVEELRPFIEDRVRCTSIKVVGKEAQGLSEIGEFTPDLVRKAFSSLGLCDKPEKQKELDLPLRPPVLCPGCAHRAFYYALNSLSQFVDCDPDRCIGCNICEYVCSVEKEKTFNPVKSRIRTIRLNPLNNIAVACRTCKDAPCVAACPKDALRQSENGTIKVDEEKCDGCGWCIGPCQYGAITLHPESRKAMLCDTCEGAPECIKWCPEGALSYKGKSTDKIVTGDIGCYTLGSLPPVNAVQTCLCMGAGISQAAGMVHAGVKEKVFAVIGDSTFFHAGMPGLLNIAYNKSNVCVVILDNHVVAMTGHQPTPGSGKNLVGEATKSVQLQDIARSLGIENVKVVDPYDLKSTTNVLREMLEYSGPCVVIAERPCPLRVEKGKVREVLTECNKCGVCIEAYGCPAISLGPDRAEIDSTLCYGCGVCEQVCPFKAIRSTE